MQRHLSQKHLQIRETCSKTRNYRLIFNGVYCKILYWKYLKIGVFYIIMITYLIQPKIFVNTHSTQLLCAFIHFIQTNTLSLAYVTTHSYILLLAVCYFYSRRVNIHIILIGKTSVCSRLPNNACNYKIINVLQKL